MNGARPVREALRWLGAGVIGLAGLALLLLSGLILAIAGLVLVVLGCPRWRARALIARARGREPPPSRPPAPPAPEVLEPTPRLRLALEFAGAAAGLTVFVAFVGGAILWVRFNALGLPADQALALLPRSILVTIGAGALAPALIAGAAVAFGISLLKPLDGAGQPRCHFAFLLRLFVLLEVFLLVWVYEIDLLPWTLVLTVTAIAGASAVWGAAKRMNGYRPAAWTFLAVFALVGAANSFVRTDSTPKIEPAAVLLEKPDEGLAGFYIGQTSDRVYLAPLTDGANAALGRDLDSMLELPRERVLALSVAPPSTVGVDAGGRAEAERLLRELELDQEAAMRPARATTPSRVRTEEPWVTFAPLVHLHARDSFRPISADGFLARSRLAWRTGGGCSDQVMAAGSDSEARLAHETLDSARLGADADQRAEEGPYRHGLGCATEGPFKANQHTRPFDKTRQQGLPRDQGFYLDLDNAARGGEAASTQVQGRLAFTGAPAYYQLSDGGSDGGRIRITYWLLYAHSVPPGPRFATPAIAHEGDWERISVLVDRLGSGRYGPLSVRYHAHEHHVDVPWADVPRVGDDGELPAVGDEQAARRATHPVGYSARGSHATFPVTGLHVSKLDPGGIGILEVHDETIACVACPVWRTWESLVEATKEPWYGFGGAWGDVRGGAAPSGPLGPSRYKLGGEETLPDLTEPEPEG